jgi:hypothetical protein
MDNTILKKKLSSFRSPKGSVCKVSPEVLHELLRAWENCNVPSREFYQSLGLNRKQWARVLGTAKKLHREGAFGALEFNEIKVGELLPEVAGGFPAPCSSIELSWDGGKVIRFPQVEQLVDFLKKSAA